jgi:hypothetical protein
MSSALLGAGVLSAASLADGINPPPLPTVSLPVTAPTVTAPTVSLPVTAPTVTAPTVTAPTVTAPTRTTATVTTPTATATVSTPVAPPPIAVPAPVATVKAAAPSHAPPSTPGAPPPAAAVHPGPVTSSAPSTKGAAPVSDAPAQGGVLPVASSPSSSTASWTPNGRQATTRTAGHSSSRRAGEHVVRLHVHREGTVFVTIRRLSDCTLRGRFRVNLNRSHGTIVIRGRVNGRRLVPGVYVVEVTRDVHGLQRLRAVTVRVTRHGPPHRTAVQPENPCSDAAFVGAWPASAVPLTWTGAAALASVARTAVGHPSAPMQPPSTSAGAGEAKALGAPHNGVIPASLPRPSTVWGTVLVIGLVGALLLAMATYVWRFLKAPIDRQ